ncbi:hypothetical protein NUW46_04860 [Marinobacter sp. MA]|uniref:hypothetical protein n=1 Tax=Marinobacter sp. MA TaxID=2971606 RepID=UPI003AB00EC8
MSRFNTGNPVPSTDPRDRSDNSQAFDEAMNSEDTTFNDRTGKSRLTLKGMEQVFDGGKPAIDAYYNAVEEADRSEAGADRSELARDAAQLSAGIYVDIAAGLAATTEGDYFSVPSADSDEYLILYRHDAGSTAIEIQRYPSAAGVEAAVGEIKKAVDYDSVYGKDADEITHLFVDQSGEIVAKITRAGEIITPSFSTSNIKGITSAIATDTERNPLYSAVLLDTEGNILLRIGLDGELYLPGLQNGVQNILTNIPEISDGPRSAALPHPDRHTLADVFSGETLKCATFRRLAGGPEGAPMPFTLFPHNYQVSDDWIFNISTTQPAPIPVDTPYFEDDGVVHPHVIEFGYPFRGYRYWMVLTPYRGSENAYENPVIYGSNDLQSFEMLNGFAQPLEDAPSGGFNSDCGWTYDIHSGDLICYWRQTIDLNTASGSREFSIRYRASKDGINWTPVQTIRPLSADAHFRSPSLLFDPVSGLWELYWFDGYRIMYETAPSLSGPWSVSQEIQMQSRDGNIQIWHGEVRYVGNKKVFLINDMENGELHLGIEGDDGKWRFNSNSVLAGSHEDAYKASFLPKFNANGEIALDIIWTSQLGTDGVHWFLYTNTTNFTAARES